MVEAHDLEAPHEAAFRAARRSHAIVAGGSDPGSPGPLRGGEYDGLLLGVERSAEGAVVSGYFSSTTGRGQFSCRFFLRGALVGSGARIATWLPGADDPPINGRLEADGRGEVQIALEREPGGCGNVQRFAGPQPPPQFSLLRARPWRSIRVVKGEASLRKSPASGSRRLRALVEGTGVGVLDAGASAPAGWIKVQVRHDGHPVTGWLRAADLFPDQAPER